MLWFKDKQCDEFKKLKNKCDQLKLDLDSLNRILKEQDISVAKEIDLVKREVADVLFNLKNEFNKKLLEFEKNADKKFLEFKGEININKIEIEKKIRDKSAETDKKLAEFNNRVLEAERYFKTIEDRLNARFLEFENMISTKIADRYFKTLEDIFRWNREFSFLDKYMQGDNKTLEGLEKTITQSFLKQKWSRAEKEKADKVDNTIKTKGENIVQKRKEFHELKLKLEREEKDTKEIDAKIQVLDFILEGAK